MNSSQFPLGMGSSRFHLGFSSFHLPSLVAGRTEPANGPLCQYFLQRLQRLLVLQTRGRHALNAVDARFIDAAILSTYCDLQALGFAREAGVLLSHFRELRQEDQWCS